MKKALLVASVQSHIAQFHRPLIKVLNEHDYRIDVAARDNLAEKNGLSIQHVHTIYNVPFERSPLNPKNFKAYRVIKKIIDHGNYDLISCNTPAAGVYTRLAARKARRKGTKVFYTAHGFHFYKGASIKNWIIFYPIEKVMAHFTDVLITITQEDYAFALKHMKTLIQHIHGVGADESKFLSVTDQDLTALKEQFNLYDKNVILCVGELNDNKNQTQLIQAMQYVVQKNPNTVLLLAGNGPKEKEQKELVHELGLEDSVVHLGYHTDIERYCHLADLVVSVSKREGLPLNIMEAMICQKAVVVSHNRGHDELVKENVNGLFVNINDVHDLAEKMNRLLEDKQKRDQFGKKGQEIVQKYTMKNVEDELKTIYLNELLDIER